MSVTLCNNSVTVVCRELGNFNALLFKDGKTKNFFLVETGFFIKIIIPYFQRERAK